MLHLDANFIVDAVLPGSSAEAQIIQSLSAGEALAMSAVAWGEFLCGPVTMLAEAAARQMLSAIEPVVAADAETAARLFNQTGRRSRTFQDCLIGRWSPELRYLTGVPDDAETLYRDMLQVYAWIQEQVN